MPNLGVNEKKSDFVPRCVSVRQKENPGEDQKQSVAICHSMYRDMKKKRKKR